MRLKKMLDLLLKGITTEDNNVLIDNDFDEEIISEENDEPEKLPKQRLFDVQAEDRFKKHLKHSYKVKITNTFVRLDQSFFSLNICHYLVSFLFIVYYM